MPTLDLSDPTQWNLVIRKTLFKGAGSEVLPIIFQVNHHELIVGIKPHDRPTWKWGGYLTELVDAAPSSTAVMFPSLIQVSRYRLTCTQYQAIYLNDALPLPFFCTIEFPVWYEEVDVEVWNRNDP